MSIVFLIFLKAVISINKAIESKVGNNIRMLREQRQITQDQLASRLQIRGCDITRSAVAKIEVGQRHLYPDEIILIKEILSVEYEDIFRI
ncbi:MAG: helix-turn-helix transcriptional regulator [Huintestinicola sp.]|uniref:helix-turn-helix transcriptional regulator n=1 Tax=Huintestinicola sp. TaxID=2981661 RepID=UPI003F10BB64